MFPIDARGGRLSASQITGRDRWFVDGVTITRAEMIAGLDAQPFDLICQDAGVVYIGRAHIIAAIDGDDPHCAAVVFAGVGSLEPLTDRHIARALEAAYRPAARDRLGHSGEPVPRK